MGGRFGGFVSSSHFVVLDQPVAIDKLYSRVPSAAFVAMRVKPPVVIKYPYPPGC